MILFPLMENSDEPLRLLLIEDDELTREVLTLQITAQGYQLETAESGDAALLQLKQMQHGLPDAVLTDLQLPGTSGQDLLHRLRTISDGGMTLLAMSASRPEDAILGGFDGFLLKPFTMKQLAVTLQSRASRPSNTALITPSAGPSTASPSL